MHAQSNMRTIACVAALRDPSTGAALTASQAGALAEQGLLPPTPDLLSILDVQLPLAAINLLYVLAAHSHRARAWLVSEPDLQGARRGLHSDHPDGDGSGSGVGGGLELLVGGVLPLVFHTMVTVRRAVARLLAAVCLGRHADRWSGWGHVSDVACMEQQQQQGGVGGGGMAGAGGLVRLPSVFKRCFVLPCRATWVELPPAAGQRETAAVALQGKPMLHGALASPADIPSMHLSTSVTTSPDEHRKAVHWYLGVSGLDPAGREYIPTTPPPPQTWLWSSGSWLSCWCRSARRCGRWTETWAACSRP